MGDDNNFHIKNDRLKRFYKDAEELSRYTNLSMDFPKQIVETLSKIADDKDFPLQEMSDKEIFAIGLLLRNLGILFFHEGDLGESLRKMDDEFADVDDSTLKSFYKVMLDDYKLVKDKESRDYITEFVYRITAETDTSS